MPDVIPAVLLPYLQATADPSLFLVTSTLSTPSHWLLLRWLHAFISLPANIVGTSASTTITGQPQGQVIFISLLQPQDLWLELAKKTGLDLASHVKNKRIVYIDGLLNPSGRGNGSLSTTQLQDLSLQGLSSAIRKAITASSTSSVAQNKRPTLVLDGLDFLLASQPNVDAADAQQFLSQTVSMVDTLIISFSADTALLHSHGNASTPLEREHSALIAAMAHQASLVFQLRGLDTGAAKDVTGVMRVSHGGSYERSESHTTEGEWLYLCKGDGTVRIWSRGE